MPSRTVQKSSASFTSFLRALNCDECTIGGRWQPAFYDALRLSFVLSIRHVCPSFFRHLHFARGKSAFQLHATCRILNASIWPNRCANKGAPEGRLET